MADDATVEILLKMRADGLDAARDTAAALGDIRTRMLEINALNFQNAMAQALAPITALGDGIQKLSSSFLGGIPFIGNFLTSLGGIPVVGPIVVAVIAAITAALIIGAASFLGALITVTAAVLTLVATTVAGFAAMALAWTLALGPLGLLTAGVILLADRMFTTKQTAVDPLLAFEQALGKVADTLGTRATPMANQFLTALMPVVPIVQQIGLQLLDWFGVRIPQVITFMRDSFFLLLTTILGLGTVFGNFIDQMALRWPQLVPIMQGFAAQFVLAIQGMLNNLLAFMDWFTKEWPKLAPIIGSILQQAGSFIQWFGAEAKRLVDWFVANWPEIARTAQNLQPVLITLYVAVATLIGIFAALMAMYNVIVDFFRGVANAASDASRAIGGVAGALSGVKGALGSMPGIPGLISGFIPGAQGGGMVPGAVGTPQLVLAHGGEAILNPEQLNTMIGLLAQLVRNTSSGGFSTRAYASRA